MEQKEKVQELAETLKSRGLAASMIDALEKAKNMGLSVINLTDQYLPMEISLNDAYPNPFNPITTLSYDVPSDMKVHLGIYDIRGRLIDELVNDLFIPGRYEVIWNADQHASGVYMVKLIAGKTVKVQKVMLLK